MYLCILQGAGYPFSCGVCHIWIPCLPEVCIYRERIKYIHLAEWVPEWILVTVVHLHEICRSGMFYKAFSTICNVSASLTLLPLMRRVTQTVNNSNNKAYTLFIHTMTYIQQSISFLFVTYGTRV